MPIQRSINVYAANELSSTAKEKARHWFRYEYAVYAIADDIEQYKEETLMPVLAALGIQAKEILYSGYSVQGDGACFTGTYHYRLDWRKALANLEEGMVSEQWKEELNRIGEALDTIHSDGGPVTCEIVHDKGHYVHSYTIHAEPSSNDPGVDVELIDDLTDELQNLAYSMWHQISEEERSLSSDEAVDEGLSELGYGFDVKGIYIG